MSCKKTITALLIVMLALIPLSLMAESSDAYQYNSYEVTRGFSDIGDGEISVYITNGTSAPVTVNIKITSTDGSRTYATKEFTIPANVTRENVKESGNHATLSFSAGGSGHKQMNLYIDDSKVTVIDINSEHSIWAEWTTYLVIIIAIIVVVVIVWMKVRSNSDKKAKEIGNEKVFTKMEEERRAKRISSEPAPEPKKAEKKTYQGSKRK